jgi:hypothetical protein
VHDILTKTKFINAMVREHLGIEEVRKAHGRDTDTEYLRLEIIPSGTKDAPTNRLVIRGNRIGTLWMIWDKEYPHSKAGICALHKAAIEIALAVAERASEKLGFPVQVGMPPVSYYNAWFQK